MYFVSADKSYATLNSIEYVETLLPKNVFCRGLIGLSKVIDVRSKFSKKTKVQLLWDFLSYQQIPRTQAIVFRVGYDLK